MLKDNRLYKSMFEAVCQTFENMAFVEVTEQSEEIETQMPQDVRWVSLLINNPIQAELRLAMTKTMLDNLTEDMFGIEKAEITTSQQKDIIAEILNTLAGLFMTKLLPPDQTYQLGLPEHGEGLFPEAEETSVIWNLQIEEAPLILIASGVKLSDFNN